jgi:hypothetical protein
MRSSIALAALLSLATAAPQSKWHSTIFSLEVTANDMGHCFTTGIACKEQKDCGFGFSCRCSSSSGKCVPTGLAQLEPAKMEKTASADECTRDDECGNGSDSFCLDGTCEHYGPPQMVSKKMEKAVYDALKDLQGAEESQAVREFLRKQML